MKKILILTIFLLTLFLFLVTVVSAQDATVSSGTIREKVQEKVTQVLNSPKAYIGTVTDISATTLQIRKFSITEGARNGEIQQIATSSETSVVSVGKTSKTLKFSDIAIGDFIVAMGYKNGNNVLEARRILVTEAVKASTRSAILAKVSKVMKTTLEVTTAKNEVFTIEQEDEISLISQTDGKQTKIKFTNIEIGDSVMAIGYLNNKVFSARKIVVINSVTASPSPTASPKASPSPTAKSAATPTATP